MTDWLYDFLHKWGEPIEHLTVAAASFTAGIWVLFRFWRERTDEPALGITMTVRSDRLGSSNLVVATVTLENKGRTRIQAKFLANAGGYIFDDGEERLRHGGSLRVRKLKEPSASSFGVIDWFAPGFFEEVPGLGSEINLLTEYVDPRKGNRVDFWMEPGESYDLGVPLTLPKGQYLAKVTFIGSASDSDFWSHLLGFSVPS
jgi:hypothetical protein